jgi:hypothetical protein
VSLIGKGSEGTEVRICAGGAITLTGVSFGEESEVFLEP